MRILRSPGSASRCYCTPDRAITEENAWVTAVDGADVIRVLERITRCSARDAILEFER